MNCAYSNEYDLVLRKGRVIDPALSIDRIADIGIKNGKIIAVGNDILSPFVTKSIDCNGYIVIPGLIDMHVHLFHKRQYLGLEPDYIMCRSGVTTMLDAGSSGVQNWDEFKNNVIKPSKANVYALMHVCKTGLDDAKKGELLDPEMADPEKTAEMVLNEPSVIKGIKIRAGAHIIGDGEQGIHNLDMAIKAARRSGSWLMVHIGNSPFALDHLTSKLGPKDVITHCYKGGEYQNGILDKHNKVFDALFDAKDRGILFDVGHGMRSFDWEVAETALDQGFLPDTISTDLHQNSLNGPVFDLSLTMTKFILLGLSLAQTVERCVTKPARMLGIDGWTGSFKSGNAADITILKWEEEYIELADGCGKTRKSEGYYKAAGYVKSGEYHDVGEKI